MNSKTPLSFNNLPAKLIVIIPLGSSRLKKFFNDFEKKDNNQIINGEEVPSMDSLINNIDWNYISKGLPSRFHGDFHFENILWNNKTNKFIFLDWRQDFEGNLKNGDIYYDFGKLLHGMLVSHKEVIKNNFNYVKNKKFIQISIKRDRNLQICKQHFFKWLKHHNYSIYKVELISSLIFLNIATLHHTKYDDFLFNFGKLQLFKTLKKHKYE